MSSSFPSFVVDDVTLLQVMKEFREGSYNTLIATCVGEEGLDIGDVDLIICFDTCKSPVRFVQRMGRTGRKRDGKIIMLITEGKEEQVSTFIFLIFLPLIMKGYYSRAFSIYP